MDCPSEELDKVVQSVSISSVNSLSQASAKFIDSSNRIPFLFFRIPFFFFSRETKRLHCRLCKRAQPGRARGTECEEFVATDPVWWRGGARGQR